MDINNREIAIIGGGPGGLTLARLLQLKGARVKVYERDADRYARVQGGALDLHTNAGLAALETASLLNEFKNNYRPGAELVRIVDSQANIYSDEHSEGRITKFGDKNHRPEIDRGPLREILLNSLQPGTVVWNSHVQSIDEEESQWKIFFQTGDTKMADIVIGADGANSRIRPFVTGLKPIWAGVTMIEGSVKNPEKTAPMIQTLLKGGKIFAYGHEQTLIVSSKGDGSLGFSVSFKSGESWVKESGIDFSNNKQILDWFRKEFSAWSNVWWELFQNEETLFIPRPQYCMPLNLHWQARPNITLIGDAAHWMPPFAGEGVNMAMLDALQLSVALTDPAFTDTRKAIAQYEKKMFARFAYIGRATLYNTQWMHQPGALNDMLAMFSKNKWKQGLFFAKYFVHVIFIPFIRKTIRL